MLRVERLNNHLASLFTTPGAPSYLGQQCESSFRGRKIGKHQGNISRNDSHQRDAWQVKAFRNHLRTHQYIGFAIGETVKQLLVSATMSGRVAVPAQQACRGKVARNGIFHLLCPQAEIAYARAVTLRTEVQYSTLPVAVVAGQEALR